MIENTNLENELVCSNKSIKIL